MGSNQRRRRRQVMQVIAIAVVVLGVLVSGSLLWATHTRQGVSARFALPGGELTARLSLAVVATPAGRAKGLMFVKKLLPRTGMIFVFPEESERSFWMKNTYVPLDIIFLDSKLEVVGILKNVPILNEEPRKVNKPSRYVVELPAGTAAEEKIVEGASLQLSKALPSPT